ncbi:hypothetical protein CsSME_00045975 [Camellia sinensis var. sinensis]
MLCCAMLCDDLSTAVSTRGLFGMFVADKERETAEQGWFYILICSTCIYFSTQCFNHGCGKFEYKDLNS